MCLRVCVYVCVCVFVWWYTLYRPVLLSGNHPHCLSANSGTTAMMSVDASSVKSQTSSGENERVLQTMRWGLVPSWHKGDPNKFGTMLNNCRIEGLQEKPSFRNALKKGQRCVIVCEG